MQLLDIAQIKESAKHSGREYREVPVAAETNWSGVRVRICVQSKRKSSYDWVRNCLVFKRWSHWDMVCHIYFADCKMVTKMVQIKMYQRFVPHLSFDKGKINADF